MPFDEVTDVLAQAWSWWADTLGAIEHDEGSWRRPTRLEGWDVAALAAHHSFLVQGLGVLAANAVDGPPAVESAEAMLRRFNQPSGAAVTAAGMVADMARQAAAGISAAAQVAVFRDFAPSAVAAVRAAGPIVIEYFGHGQFPLAEAARIAILEAVVHGQDLCAALDVDPTSLPGEAVTATVTLLASIPGPLEFIEAATGRGATPILPVIR
jgi:uncharacterized protein (TIGR03083 family)